MPAADEPTLRLFLRGDPVASRRVEGWAREIVRFRAYGMPDEEQADTVQDTLVGVWRAVSAPDFALTHSLKAMVRQVAVARCIDRLRRRKPTTELSELLPDEAPNPYEETLRRDEKSRIAWALQELSDGCRDIIVKHFYENIPYRELAQQEQRAEATLRSRMFECMKKLRALATRWL